MVLATLRIRVQLLALSRHCSAARISRRRPSEFSGTCRQRARSPSRAFNSPPRLSCLWRAALIDAAEAVRKALAALPRRARDDDETVGEAARIAARRVLMPERDKRPVVEVQVVRI